MSTPLKTQASGRKVILAPDGAGHVLTLDVGLARSNIFAYTQTRSESILGRGVVWLEPPCQAFNRSTSNKMACALYAGKIQEIEACAGITTIVQASPGACCAGCVTSLCRSWSTWYERLWGISQAMDKARHADHECQYCSKIWQCNGEGHKGRPCYRDYLFPCTECWNSGIWKRDKVFQEHYVRKSAPWPKVKVDDAS
jgi:hypothetical protein